MLKYISLFFTLESESDKEKGDNTEKRSLDGPGMSKQIPICKRIAHTLAKMYEYIRMCIFTKSHILS